MQKDIQNLGPVKTQLKILFQQNSAFLVSCLIYFVFVYGAAYFYQLEDLFRLDNYLKKSAGIATISFFILLIGNLFYVLIAQKIKSPLTHLFGQIKGYFTDWPFMVNALLATLLIPLITSLYTSLKSMIPFIVPHYLDEIFMKIDQTLHFGVHPWVITHAIFGNITSTVAINFFYHLWFFLMWAFLFWHVVFNKNLRKRMQFILTFVLSWFLFGNVLALVLSSAGPVYYADITGLTSPFTPLMDSLYSMDAVLEERGGWFRIWALNPQQNLWADFLAGRTGEGAGISAMPSMHIAIAMLMTLSAFQLHKYLGYMMTGFLIITLIGSVHLGWHYAIDGYLSIGLVYGLWKLSGWLVKKTFPPE